MAFKINAVVEPHYPLKRSQLIKAAKTTLELAEIKSDVVLDISVIGDRKMRQLNRQYRDQDKTTDVLAFNFESDQSGEFVNPPVSDLLNLGDVLISYPQLIERAAKENMLVDEMANLLVVHGILHLLGHDHEKPQDAFIMEQIEDQILKVLNPQLEVIK